MLRLLGTILIVCVTFSLAQNSPFAYQRIPKNEPTNTKCRESCAPGGTPKKCSYEWYIGWFWTMSKACMDCPRTLADCFRPHCVTADGFERAILVANKQMVGPDIQVCQGDTVEVHIHNHLEGGEGTSIHWHGQHQRGTPWMDGVSQLTQCSIPSRSSFTYTFPANTAGTHFWHGHTSMQRADGLAGAFIVRTSDDAKHSLYDYDLHEHVVLISDWLHEMTTSKFAHHHHDDGRNKPESMLINGKGVFQNITINGTDYQTPREVFTVERGKRYRFRVISNGILYCPIRISIDNHKMTVIASDGSEIEPYEVDSFMIYAGERFDFVLHANQAVGNFWFRAKGYQDCAVFKSHQEAIVNYKGAPASDPPGDTLYESGPGDGHQLNPWNRPEDKDHVPIYKMNSSAPHEDWLDKEPDHSFFMTMDFNKIDDWHFNDPRYYPLRTVPRKKHLYTPQINHTSFVLPNAPPLTQWNDIDQDMICPQYHNVGSNCKTEYCACMYNLYVEKDDVVELVIIDEGVTFPSNHPMHLHGHSFRVLGIDKLGTNVTLETIRKMDQEGKLIRKLKGAPIKDTVTVPDGGYTILRFLADNPGIWLMHCHLEFHVEIGMSFTISIGDPKDWPEPPKDFPRCGDFGGLKSVRHFSQRDMEKCEEQTNHAPKLSSHTVLSATVALCFFLLIQGYVEL